jgi:hypothetical protein
MRFLILANPFLIREIVDVGSVVYSCDRSVLRVTPPSRLQPTLGPFHNVPVVFVQASMRMSKSLP